MSPAVSRVVLCLLLLVPAGPCGAQKASQHAPRCIVTNLRGSGQVLLHSTGGPGRQGCPQMLFHLRYKSPVYRCKFNLVMGSGLLSSVWLSEATTVPSTGRC